MSTGLGLDQLSPSFIPHPTHGAHLWRQRSLLSREKEGEVLSGHCHSADQLWDPGGGGPFSELQFPQKWSDHTRALETASVIQMGCIIFMAHSHPPALVEE